MTTSKILALTAAEFNELSTLAFRNANDLPMTQEETNRYLELRRKEERRVR